MAEGVEYCRRWERGPDNGEAADQCMANGVALAELGLAVGDPPRPVESLHMQGDWHMFLCLDLWGVAAAEPLRDP